MSHKTLIIILITLIFFSCDQERREEIQQTKDDIAMLENAPDAGIPVYDNSANFEVALGNYKDSSEIKYTVVNAPPKMTFEQGCEIVNKAIDQWANAVQIPFRWVDSANQANIVVEFRFMDGKGGQLGQTDFPPYSKIKDWNRKLVMDAYDVNGDSDFDGVTIAAHEFGHAVGLNDSQDPEALMWRVYYDGQKMGIDDQFGARYTYNNKKKFQFGGRTYIPITDTAIQITENFLMSEFFSRCTEFPYEFHFLDEGLVTAIQIIRYTYDQPIQILSTYRPHECNHSVGGVRLSKHMRAEALDFKFIGVDWKKATELFVNEIRSKGCLFQTLINTGIGGFGAYDHSFHIDTRRTGLHKWFNLKYAIWGGFADGALWIDIEHPDGIIHE